MYKKVLICVSVFSLAVVSHYANAALAVGDGTGASTSITAAYDGGLCPDLSPGVSSTCWSVGTKPSPIMLTYDEQAGSLIKNLKSADGNDFNFKTGTSYLLREIFVVGKGPSWDGWYAELPEGFLWESWTLSTSTNIVLSGNGKTRVLDISLGKKSLNIDDKVLINTAFKYVGEKSITATLEINQYPLSQVPLPATAWLFLSALGSLAIIKRKLLPDNRACPERAFSCP